jgi:hypothetical protein
MNRTLPTPDERLNDLVTEIAELTGEDYVTAMCRALEERRDRLIQRRPDGTSPRVIRITVEADIADDLLRRSGT